MELNHTKNNDVDIVHFSGQLVMANAEEAREQIKPIVDASSGQLILDLQAVNFMDSSGLSVLVSALKAIREKQGEVLLTHVHPSVQNLIELTRLHQVFKLFPDNDSALHYFSSRES